ncbi:MAG: LamG-like jellyroll fold domain-containing protein [Phycisphaeraceae bacterium]
MTPNMNPRSLLIALTLLALGAPAVATTYLNEVLSDAPASYWRLGDTGSPAVDHIAARNGVYSGGVTPGAPGMVGDSNTATSFNGTTGKIDVPFNAALNTNAFTIEAWANVAGGSGLFRSPVTSRDGSNINDDRGYILYAAADNTWQFWTGPGVAAWDILPGPAVVIGQNTHLVGTFTPTSGPDANGTLTGTKSFYVNGMLASTATQRYEANQVQPFRIGAGATEGAGAFHMNGSVDEVAYYNTALNANAVADHYGASKGNLFFAAFNNPGGVGLGSDASKLVNAGQTGAFPTPTNPDSVLVLGGSGSGGQVFIAPVSGADLTKPFTISTQAFYVNPADAPPVEQNKYFGLVALQRQGTAATDPQRRGGVFAQFQQFTTGTGRFRFGFQTDSPDASSDAFLVPVSVDIVTGFSATGNFNLDWNFTGLEDSDLMIFTASQGTSSFGIQTSILAFRNALSLPARDSFDLMLAEVRANPTSMNIGFLSTAAVTEGYRFLAISGSAIPEPASASLLVLGAMGLLARRRKVA